MSRIVVLFTQEYLTLFSRSWFRHVDTDTTTFVARDLMALRCCLKQLPSAPAISLSHTAYLLPPLCYCAPSTTTRHSTTMSTLRNTRGEQSIRVDDTDAILWPHAKRTQTTNNRRNNTPDGNQPHAYDDVVIQANTRAVADRSRATGTATLFLHATGFRAIAPWCMEQSNVGYRHRCCAVSGHASFNLTHISCMLEP